MSENEPSPEKKRMVYDSGRDRLSELPSSIMDIIMSSISTRDAVRMSVLSNQYSLQKLKGNYFTKIMSHGVDSCQYSFVLPCLEVIELDEVNFKDLKETSIVARLVAGAPNLQELKLTSVYYEEEEAGSASDVPDMEFIFPPNFKCQDLRIITLWNITISPSQMEFLKLLLENSPALERLNIRPYGFSSHEDECLRAQVLKFNIASPNLTIWFG